MKCVGKENLQASLGNQAMILKNQGKFDKTNTLLKSQEQICREFSNIDGLITSLGNLAIILNDCGEID